MAFQIFAESGTFTVPSGITSITVTCIGAGSYDNHGGGGGYAKGTLSVTPGQQFAVDVGNQFWGSEFWENLTNPGAAGTSFGTAIIAGGGGASGVNSSNQTGPGSGHGGEGGGGAGQSGTDGTGGGGGGTQSAGGAGGTAGVGGLAGDAGVFGYVNGVNSGLVGGGKGGYPNVNTYRYGGGGGGGGYYGGGGGGATSDSVAGDRGAGGGGGSNYVSGTNTVSEQSVAGVNYGAAEVAALGYENRGNCGTGGDNQGWPGLAFVFWTATFDQTHTESGNATDTSSGQVIQNISESFTETANATDTTNAGYRTVSADVVETASPRDMVWFNSLYSSTLFTTVGPNAVTIPAGSTRFVAKVWGAGGGRGTGVASAGGGFGGITYPLAGITSLIAHVGGSTSSNAGGVGGGAAGGGSAFGGGGYSGVFKTSISQANAIIMAGGGGGQGQYAGTSGVPGGGGGGEVGEKGDDGSTFNDGGKGGTQTAGGAGGVGVVAGAAGTALAGGVGAAGTIRDGGGGGGGWFGGGGGGGRNNAGYGAGGGGGSGYAETVNATQWLLIGATGAGAANNTDGDYASNYGYSGIQGCIRMHFYGPYHDSATILESGDARDSSSCIGQDAVSHLEVTWAWDTCSGGRPLTSSITEAATATETSDRAFLYGALALEAATATEVSSYTSGDIVGCVETAPAVELLVAEATMAVAITEALTASESNSCGLTLPAALVEASTLIDSSVAERGQYASVSEACTASTIEFYGIGIPSQQIEVLTATVTQNGNIITDGEVLETEEMLEESSILSLVNADITEVVSAGENSDHGAVFARYVEEHIDAFDTSDVGLTLPVICLEVASASDTSTLGGTYGVDIFEYNTSQDIQDAEYLGYIDQQETANALATHPVLGTFAALEYEGALALELSSIKFGASGVRAEPLTASETQSVTVVASAGIVELANNVGDSNSVGYGVSVSETATANHSQSCTLSRWAFHIEALSAQDVVSSIGTIYTALMETAAGSDTCNGHFPPGQWEHTPGDESSWTTTAPKSGTWDTTASKTSGWVKTPSL